MIEAGIDAIPVFGYVYSEWIIAIRMGMCLRNGARKWRSWVLVLRAAIYRVARLELARAPRVFFAVLVIGDSMDRKISGRDMEHVPSQPGWIKTEPAVLWNIGEIAVNRAMP